MDKIPAPTGGSGGTEKRGQILPSKEPEDTGFKLPEYDFAGNLTPPNEVGVKRGGGFDDVMNAARGIVYYTDVMGFGQSTNSMTSGLPFKKLGINFFMKSGLKCTNNEDMWLYFRGIPDGSALGKRVGDAIVNMGYPPMRGLAPGILEDTKAALDPSLLLRSMFGAVNPVCEQKTLPVGDDDGRIADPVTGDKWILGDVQYKDGRPTQTRWVQKTKGNGDPVFVDEGEADTMRKAAQKQGFQDQQKASLLVAVVLFALAFAVVKKK